MAANSMALSSFAASLAKAAKVCSGSVADFAIFSARLPPRADAKFKPNV